MSTEQATDTDTDKGDASAMAVENSTTSSPTPAPMTEEQKFFFDLKGWILVPSILTETEVEEMKAEVYAAVEPDNKGKNSGLKGVTTASWPICSITRPWWAFSMRS